MVSLLSYIRLRKSVYSKQTVAGVGTWNGLQLKNLKYFPKMKAWVQILTRFCCFLFSWNVLKCAQMSKDKCLVDFENCYVAYCKSLPCYHWANLYWSYRLQGHPWTFQHHWTQHLEARIQGSLQRIQGSLQWIQGTLQRIQRSLQRIFVQTRNSVNQERLLQIQVRVSIAAAQLRNSRPILQRLSPQVRHRVSNPGRLRLSAPLDDDPEVGLGRRTQQPTEARDVVQHKVRRTHRWYDFFYSHTLHLH